MAENRTLQILITAKDEASKAMKGIEGNLKSLEPSFKKISTIGAVGFTALAGAVGLSVKAFQESETANKRLEQIATQVTGATEEQINGYKRLSEELQKIGVVEDDVVKAGQSQLASFSKNSETINILSKDLADLAVAQYGVNVSQDQAIQTANIMGKALTGQLGALTRTGILVNDEFKTAFENANNEQERAIILSQIIQDNYGGLNEAMRETSAGGIQALKNSFGDLQEVIGENFIPIITSLIQKITPIIEKVGNWAKENGELLTKIVMVSGAILGAMAVLYPMLKVITTMVSVFKMLGSVIMFLTSPIGLVVLAIAALIAIILLVRKHWDEIVLFFDETLNAIVGFFNRAGDFVMGIWEKVFGWFGARINDLKLVFSELGKWIDGIFNSIGEAIKGAFKGTVNWVIDKLNWLIRQANKITSKLSIIPGVNIPSIPEIPKLAKGGIVNRPTLAMIGEAGPEAVVPLNRKNNPLNGGITIIVNGDISGQDLIDKVSNAIMGNLRTNTQLSF